MVNYIVDDLDALLDRLKQEGVKIDPKRMNAFYDHFAWIYDSDGNKIETLAVVVRSHHPWRCPTGFCG